MLSFMMYNFLGCNYSTLWQGWYGSSTRGSGVRRQKMVSLAWHGVRQGYAADGSFLECAASLFSNLLFLMTLMPVTLAILMLRPYTRDNASISLLTVSRLVFAPSLMRASVTSLMPLSLDNCTNVIGR